MRISPSRVAVFLLLLSLATNVALAYRIRVKDAEHNEFRRVMVLGIGNFAQPFVANEGGRQVVIEPPDLDDERDLIIYGYSPQCPLCELNAPSFDAFAKAVSPTADVLFVVLDADSSETTRYGAPMTARVVGRPARETLEAYKMGSTPQTIVVRRGKIIANWFGTYRGRNWEEISQAYKLPALPIAPAAGR